MSKERELLERALGYLVKANQAWSTDFEDEIRACLTESNVKREPPSDDELQNLTDSLLPSSSYIWYEHRAFKDGFRYSEWYHKVTDGQEPRVGYVPEIQPSKNEVIGDSNHVSEDEQ